MVIKNTLKVASTIGLVAASVSSTAVAENYISTNAQLLLPTQTDLDYDDPAFALLAEEIDLKTGFGIGGAIGTTFKDNYRVEGELTYRLNNTDDVTNRVTGQVVASTGEISSLSLMANAYYDYQGLKQSTNITPYIGTGIGVAAMKYQKRNADFNFDVDDTDSVFAYQAMLGASYELNEKSSVYTGYRYFGTIDGEYADSDGDRLEAGYDIHAIEIGYRRSF